MKPSILHLGKTAGELRKERDMAVSYLERIAGPDPSSGFINRRALAAEAIERLGLEKPHNP